jgi:hypothetical protein
MFVSVPSMSECLDNHEQEVVEERVNGPVITHLQSVSRSTA